MWTSWRCRTDSSWSWLLIVWYYTHSGNSIFHTLSTPASVTLTSRKQLPAIQSWPPLLRKSARTLVTCNCAMETYLLRTGARSTRASTGVQDQLHVLATVVLGHNGKFRCKSCSLPHQSPWLSECRAKNKAFLTLSFLKKTSKRNITA